jgi:FlaA1/EpsC-like NDP-sugar epimerase
VKIVDLARDLIRLSGLKEGVDIEIAYTGLRPGEKMSEELFYASERPRPTTHDKILVCPNGLPEVPSRGGGLAVYEQPLKMDIDALIEAAHLGSSDAIVRLLKKIVPEYSPPDMDQYPVSAEPASRAAEREQTEVPAINVGQGNGARIVT